MHLQPTINRWRIATNDDCTATTQVPDAAGRFGQFGGRYVPETLIRALDELAVEYDKACQDADVSSRAGRRC